MHGMHNRNWRKGLRLASLGAALAAGSFVASGGIIRHDVELEQYVRLAAEPAFRSVGRYADAADPDDVAGGVLVAPRWVLTASHFLGEQSTWTFGDKEVYHAVRVVRHPRVGQGPHEAQWSGFDLALVELDRPVANVAPAVRYRGRAEVGATVTKVGYGYVGNGRDGMKAPPTQMRLAGQNVIDAAGGELDGREFSSDVLAFDFDGPGAAEANRMGSPEPLPLEIGGSKGDSGGGVFLEEDGEWRLAGIVSGALSRQIRYGAVAALARVSSANDWIDSVVGEPAKP